MRFSRKTAFVTGAGTGIGRGIAMRLASEGARLIVTDINSKSAKSAACEIQRSGGKALDRRLDVSDPIMVENVVAESWKLFGRVDYVINNAGVSSVNHFWELSEQDWDHNMNVNAKGTFLVCVAMAKRMIKHRYPHVAKIVNIASGAGVGPDPLRAHYCASKHAVIGLTKTAALELAPYHITVNAVCPGLVQTSMQERELGWESRLRRVTISKLRKEYLGQVPLGRLETPDDVAATVAFLCSSDADYITGQSINVNGGSLVH